MPLTATALPFKSNVIELITELNEKAFRRDYRIKCNGINVTVEDGIQHDVIWMEPKRGVPPLFPLQTFIYEFIHNFFPFSFTPTVSSFFSSLFSANFFSDRHRYIFYFILFFFASLPSRGWSSFQFTFFFHGGDFYNPTSYAALVSMCDPIQLITTKLATVGPDIPFWSSFLLLFFFEYSEKNISSFFVFFL